MISIVGTTIFSFASMIFSKNTIPVIGYIKNEIFYIDLKAVTNDQIDDLIKTINKVLI